jgi:hypothetical protein
MSDTTTVRLMPPFGQGEPKVFEAKPEVIVPLLVAGWSQCDPLPAEEEVKNDVHD